MRCVAQLVRPWVCFLEVTSSSPTNLRATRGRCGRKGGKQGPGPPLTHFNFVSLLGNEKRGEVIYFILKRWALTLLLIFFEFTLNLHGKKKQYKNIIL
jgi:hypothetical protein